ncbi:MAG: hypothetical protein U1E05_02880 [Patescibacteria group bacterium]|nr:hypothetical protein [Patescibacteria group bacterium]
MLTCALGFLVAIGLVLPHGESGGAFRDWLWAYPPFKPLMATLWALIVLEGLLGLLAAPDAWSKRLGRFLLTSLVPPMRMVTASSTPAGWLWVPSTGWMPVGKKTLMALEQKVALPMAMLTLLVLPVLAVELTYGSALDKHAGVALGTHLLTSLIWLGFAVEFQWMVAAAPKRLTYCTQHWINLVIVLVPLVAFLRVLNMLRLSRMVRAGRLLRAYRLRGLSSRMWRLVMLFNLFERLQQRDPAKSCAALEAKIADLEEEMDGLRAKLAAARKRLQTASSPVASSPVASLPASSPPEPPPASALSTPLQAAVAEATRGELVGK